MSTAASGWRRTWVELRAAAVPIAAYWAMTALAFGLLLALYIIDEGDVEGVMIFGALAATTFAGIGTGQIAALFRLRTWVIAVVATGIWSSLLLLAAFPALPEEVMIVVAITVTLFPFFLLAGLWSLRVHMGLLATWAPLMYITVSIIVIAEQFTGKAAAWFDGDKWAIWDIFSLPVLLLGAGFLIVFLAARERHRVQLWRFAKGGPELPRANMEVRKGVGLGCGQIFAILALAMVLAGGAALTAPYLWRSAPAEDGDGEGYGDGMEPQEPPPPPEQESSGCNQDSSEGEGDGEGEGEAEGEGGGQESMEEAVKQAGISFATLILAVLLALLGLFIFLPPMRRSLLLRHLHKPLWPVPPTRQVLQAWRVVEIALADIGIERRPGDSAVSLARRAMEALPPDVDHEDLLRCAEITDRVLFGLGVDPGDPEHARRTAEMTYQVVWELMGEGRRLQAVYRLV